MRDPQTEADLERNWMRLHAKSPSERRIAIVLAGDPNCHGRIATAHSTARLLAALKTAGYRVEDAPLDGVAAMTKLLTGPSSARPGASDAEDLSFAAYSAFFASLPMSLQHCVVARWGAAERDPLFRPGRLDCGRFAIPGFRCGNIAVVIQPARGGDFDPAANADAPGPVPPHSCLAVFAWLTDEFRADAVIDLGRFGPWRWPPGKTLALVECPPEAMPGSIPHLYPIVTDTSDEIPRGFVFGWLAA